MYNEETQSLYRIGFTGRKYGSQGKFEQLHAVAVFGKAEPTHDVIIADLNSKEFEVNRIDYVRDASND